MFAAYRTGSAESESVVEEPTRVNTNSNSRADQPSTSGSAANAPRFEPADYSTNVTDKIKQKRKEKERQRKLDKQLEAAKEFLALKAINSEMDDSDEDQGCSIPAPTAVYNSCTIPQRVKKAAVVLRGNVKEEDSNDNRSERRHKKKRGTDRKRKRSRSPSCSSTSSFESSSEEERKKKKRSRRRSSKSSSSDSDRGRRRSHKKKGKKHKKKNKKQKNKHRKRHCSTSTSSESSDEEMRSRTSNSAKSNRQEKYCYLRHHEEENKDGSWLIYHKLDDKTNFNYAEMYKGETSGYYVNVTKVFNGNMRLTEVFYPESVAVNKIKPPRFHQAKPSSRKTENKFRTLSNEPSIDFMKLSDPWEEFEFLHEIKEKDDSRRAEEERGRSGDLRSKEFMAVEERLRKVKRELHSNPRPADVARLYKQFLDLEDEAFRKQPGQGHLSAHNERKLSILREALARCPRSVELHLKKIEVMRDTVVDVQEVLDAWNQLLNVFVNSCALWRKYLEFIQYDAKIYNTSRMEKAFKKCITKLGDIKDGVLVSHRPEQGTDEFLLEVFIRQLNWLIDRGYTERAVASIQASLEFMYCVPESMKGEKYRTKEAVFRKYWDSNLPRLGDRLWKGWDAFYEAGERVEESVRSLETFEMEYDEARKVKHRQRIGAVGPEVPQSVNWVALERGIYELSTRPQRTELLDHNENQDVNCMVAFEDVCLDRSGIHGAFYHILVAFGLQLPAFDALYPSFTCIGLEWGLLPVTPGFPAEVVLHVVRIATQIAKRFSSDSLTLATLPTYAMYLDLPRTISIENKVRMFKEETGRMMKESSNDDVKRLMLFMSAREMICRSWGSVQKRLPTALTLLNSYMDIAKQKNEGGLAKLDHLSAFLLLSTTLLIVEHKANLEEVGMLLTRLVLLDNLDSRTTPNPQEILEASRLWAEWDNDPVDPISEEHPLHEWLSQEASPQDMVSALRMLFEYWKGGKHGGVWLTRCQSMVQQAERRADKSSFVMRNMLVNILDRHWKTQHSHKQQLLESLQAFARYFPTHSLPLKKLVDLAKTSVTGRVNATKSLENMVLPKKSPAQRRLAQIQRAFARMSLYTTTNSSGTSVLVGANAAATCERDATALKEPLLWRLALAATANAGQHHQEMMHVTASAQCRWARELHLDRILQRNEDADKLRLLMLELDLRLCTEEEEMMVFREAHARQQAAENRAEEDEAMDVDETGSMTVHVDRSQSFGDAASVVLVVDKPSSPCRSRQRGGREVTRTTAGGRTIAAGTVLGEI